MWPQMLILEKPKIAKKLNHNLTEPRTFGILINEEYKLKHDKLWDDAPSGSMDLVAPVVN